jgi:hypothetical protein
LLDRAAIRSPGGFVFQGGYGGKQLTTVADRGHTNADQIVCRQFRQHHGVDIVVTERRFILLKPQPAQPAGHINRHRRRSPDQSAGCHS